MNSRNFYEFWEAHYLPEGQVKQFTKRDFVTLDSGITDVVGICSLISGRISSDPKLANLLRAVLTVSLSGAGQKIKTQLREIALSILEQHFGDDNATLSLMNANPLDSRKLVNRVHVYGQSKGLSSGSAMELAFNTFKLTLLILLIDSKLSLGQIVEELSNVIWERSVEPSHSVVEGALLMVAAPAGSIGILTRHFNLTLENLKRDFSLENAHSQRLAQRLKVLEIADAERHVELTRIEVMNRRLMGELSSTNDLLVQEKANKSAIGSQLANGIESLRGEILHSLGSQAQLLEDSLLAFQAGQFEISQEFGFRALASIRKEIERLKNLGEY